MMVVVMVMVMMILMGDGDGAKESITHYIPYTTGSISNSCITDIHELTPNKQTHSS